MFQCSKNIKLCLVCVCLILKKADTCTKYQFFNSGERIHLIVLLLLCVCSFLFLLFPFSSLREENETHAPHLHRCSPLIHGWASPSLDLLSTFSTLRPSNKSFLLCHHQPITPRSKFESDFHLAWQWVFV